MVIAGGDDNDEIRRVMYDLGARISEIRRRKKLTQSQVAARIPMHIAQYKHIEQGRRDVLVSSIHRVAKALGVPLATLFRPPRTPRPRARVAAR